MWENKANMKVMICDFKAQISNLALGGHFDVVISFSRFMMPSYIVWGNLCFGYFKNCFEWRKSPVYTTLSLVFIKKNKPK